MEPVLQDSHKKHNSCHAIVSELLPGSTYMYILYMSGFRGDEIDYLVLGYSAAMRTCGLCGNESASNFSGCYITVCSPE